MGSFLRIQETCSTYQVSRGKVLRRTVPMGEGSSGEFSFRGRRDVALTCRTGGGHSAVMYHC